MILDQPASFPRAALGAPERRRQGRLPPALSACIGYDILDRLEDVEVATLIVWGLNDRLHPPHRRARVRPTAEPPETVIFDRCGHVPMVERPVRFNRVLEAFLARET